MAGSLISGLWRRESSCFHREPTLFPSILHQPARCFMSKIVCCLYWGNMLCCQQVNPCFNSLVVKSDVFDDFDFLCQMRKHGEKKSLVFKPLAGVFQTPNQSNLAKSAKVWRGCSENGWVQSQSRPIAQSESQVASRLHFLLFKMDISPGGQILAWQPRQVFSCACLSCLA